MKARNLSATSSKRSEDMGEEWDNYAKNINQKLMEKWKDGEPQRATALDVIRATRSVARRPKAKTPAPWNAGHNRSWTKI